MYCTKCGTKNDDDSMFCTNCGTGLQNIDIGATDINKVTGVDIGATDINKITGVDIGTTDIKKPVNKDIRVNRFGKINIKNRNVLIIAILGIAIIVSASLIYISKNNANKYADTGDATVIQDADNAIVISDGQGQNSPNKETVEVLISSIPSGADTYINNISRGKTPIKINLPEGDYSLKMNLTGYIGIISKFNVTRDMERQNISAKFEPETTAATTNEPANGSTTTNTNEPTNLTNESTNLTNTSTK